MHMAKFDVDRCYKLQYNLAHGHATHILLEHRDPAKSNRVSRNETMEQECVLTINIAEVLITPPETVLQERQTLSDTG